MILEVTYLLGEDRTKVVEYEVADAAEALFTIASLQAVLDQLLEQMRNPRPLPDTPFMRMGLKELPDRVKLGSGSEPVPGRYHERRRDDGPPGPAPTEGEP